MYQMIKSTKSFVSKKKKKKHQKVTVTSLLWGGTIQLKQGLDKRFSDDGAKLG